MKRWVHVLWILGTFLVCILVVLGIWGLVDGILAGPCPEGLQYVFEDGHAVITGYTEYEASLVIPSKIKGRPVTLIRYLGDQYTLEEIRIPAGAQVEQDPFAECFALRRLEVDEKNPYLKVADGVLFSRDGEELICYPSALSNKTYEIPAGTKRIGIEAFSWADFTLEHVIVPEGVEVISPYAFSHCFGLLHLDLPSSLRELGGSALLECGLHEADLTKCTQLTAVKDETFSMCFDLEHVRLPGSVKDIGNSAFSYCDDLLCVEVPGRLEHLGQSVFEASKKLECVITSDALLTAYCQEQGIPVKAPGEG